MSIKSEKLEKSAAALRPAEKDGKSIQVGREEKILDFWREHKIFEKSLEKESLAGEFIFYEGPPGANGVPMLHHFEARAFKDVIPRYKTMRGFRVDRRAGWDCHGLPVEIQAEKELGLQSKKDIESMGIEKFNAECKKIVTRYTKEWETFTDRMGFWVDNSRAYFTMSNDFIESSWNIIAKASERGYLYQDYKILPWCARCGTGLSSHELGQPGVYEDVKDLSVTAKFKIVGTENGYFLAWTTTPWTLPGNVGLAVGKDISYVEIKIGDEILVIAKDRLEIITDQYEIIAEHKGSEMVGMEYEPLYPYFKDLAPSALNLAPAYKVYAADFVNTEDGTGIVHTAVMYGADDFELGTKVGLPKFHLVNPDGTFIKGTGFLEGKFVKPARPDDSNRSGGGEDVAVDIVKDLAHRGLLFKKEKYEHSYPHCWRCKTPLIYYARASWYFAMSKLRDELVARNETINWEPEHIKEGRFGEWIREARDWAVSRERYWGTPLPVWIADDGEKIVVDSFETLKKYAKKSGNKYFVMRHGQSVHNVDGTCSAVPDHPHHLTDEGKNDAAKSGERLKSENITVIYCSPYVRTRETAEIVAEAIGFDKSKIIIDERLQEFKFGDFDGKLFKDYMAWRKEVGDTVDLRTPNGESVADARQRFSSFYYDIDTRHAGENILVVTHGIGMEVLAAIENGYADEVMWEKWHLNRILPGGYEEFPFVPLPHNANYELDPHRPFIDEIVLEKDGKEFRRVKEVMDVWFDSGCVPFAQDHYPFENKEWIEGKGYPADFISEAIDQTRGWFYTLLAVSALIDKPAPFKNAICLGHLLDAKGQKMSKSKGNVIDAWEEMEKFGADTVRFWMYTVTAPGDSKNYDEKVVKEIQGKIFTLLENCYKFYELYAGEEKNLKGADSSNVLDKWILSLLNKLIAEGTESLEKYDLFRPTRSLRDFVSDFSTWYIRRSRDKFKGDDEEDKNYALATTKHVFIELAKFMAPFAPFFAEELYLKVSGEKESVHLEDWPEAGEINSQILENMRIVRNIVSLGLEARQKAGIPVRQPLSKLQAVSDKLEESYVELIKDELNIKEISLEARSQSLRASVVLNTEITPLLKREGDYRELLRAIQDMRKEKGLTPADVISLTLPESARETVSGFEDDMKKVVLAKEIDFSGEEIKIKK